MKYSTNSILLVGVYVDELIVKGSEDYHIKQFKEEMMKKFEMCDLRLLSLYLGKKYIREIRLSQMAYVARILE